MESHRTEGFALAFAGAILLRATLIPLAEPLAGQSDQHAAGALFVAVHGATNGPIPSAKIEIDGDGRAFKLEAFAKRDGTYSGPTLAPGRYRIIVTAQCYENYESGFEVTAGHPANATITLKPATGASGCEGDGFEFADSGGLKAGEINSAVDAAGYSSQAEAKSTELRQALAEVVAIPDRGNTTKDQAESSLFNRGNELMRRGDYQQAAGVFQDGTDHYPRSANMLLGLGVAYYAGGHYDEAAAALCKAVDLNPADPRPYFFLAQSDWSTPGQSAPVLHRLQANASSHPGDAAAQYYYAMALRRAQTLGESGIDTRELESLLRSAVALDDSLAEAHFELGVILSTNHRADAIAEFQRAIALQPDWAEAHYRLSQLYQGTGSVDSAQSELAEYDRLHKRGPAEREQRLRDEIRRLLGGESRSQGLAVRSGRPARP
jgi:tetratricopeptide (TPR) repeat protein